MKPLDLISDTTRQAAADLWRALEADRLAGSPVYSVAVTRRNVTAQGEGRLVGVVPEAGWSRATVEDCGVEFEMVLEDVACSACGRGR